MKKLPAAAVLSCLSFALLRGPFAQEPPRTDALVQQLQSPQETDAAARLLLQRATSSTKDRAYLASHLPAIISKGPDEAPQPWINAVRLAGSLKITEAAPALAKWIGLKPSGALSLGQMVRVEDNPPAKALAQIGDPAIPALLGVLERGNLSERWSAVLALHLIDSSKAKTAMREHLKRETDPSLREFIQRTLQPRQP
jgi:hypothetical protein